MEYLDRSRPPKIHNFGKLSLPRPRHTVLDNGIDLVVLDQGEQEISRLSVIKSGGLKEAPNIPVATLAAELVREGTETRSGAEISESLDFDGAWVKSTVQLHYTSTVLHSLNSRFDHSLATVYDIVNNPVFPPRETAALVEKLAAKNEVNREKVTYWASKELNKLLKGPKDPYNFDLTPDEIRAITSEEIRDWYYRTLNPKNTTIFLSGRITPRMEDAVNKTFGQMTAKGPGAPVVFREMQPSPDHSTVSIDRPGALQTAIGMGLIAIPRTNPDYIPLRLVVTALGGYFGSRLMLNIREEKGYTYGIGASLAGTGNTGIMKVTTECDNRYARAVVDEIGKEIVSMADPTSYTLDELERLRRYVMSLLAASLDSPFSMMDCYENILLSDTPKDYFDLQQEAVHSMTPESLAAVAARYLDPGKLYTVLCGDISAQ